MASVSAGLSWYPAARSTNGSTTVDPTLSTGRRDSLLNEKKKKCGLIFEFWKIRPQGGTILLWSRHLLSIFIL